MLIARRTLGVDTYDTCDAVMLVMLQQSSYDQG